MTISSEMVRERPGFFDRAAMLNKPVIIEDWEAAMARQRCLHQPDGMMLAAMLGLA